MARAKSKRERSLAAPRNAFEGGAVLGRGKAVEAGMKSRGDLWVGQWVLPLLGDSADLPTST